MDETSGTAAAAAGEEIGSPPGAGPPAPGGRRWRRANAPGGRQHAHRVRVTPEEEGRLLVLAGRAGVSVPRLLVESALAAGEDGGGETATQRHDALVELFGVRRLLAGVASNVNQVAKVGNATGRVPPETDAVLEAVERVAARVDEVIDALGAGGTRRPRAAAAGSSPAGGGAR